jgi:hypothetical protein
VNDLALHDPCILFALGRESQGFRREFRPNQRFPGAPCWARFCGPAWLSVLVLETGMGAQAVEQALDWVFSKPKLDHVPYEPGLLLFAGFAGSLSESLGVGDLLLATDVLDCDGERWQTTWPGQLPGAEWCFLRRGTILTAPHVVGTSAEKRRLGLVNQADVVDMESAVFARRCSKHGIPFGCLRAISDAVATPLSPHLVSLLSGGRVSWWRVVGALMRHPSLFMEFLRLGRDTRVASEQLGMGIGKLLTLTLDWFE